MIPEYDPELQAIYYAIAMVVVALFFIMVIK